MGRICHICHILSDTPIPDDSRILIVLNRAIIGCVLGYLMIKKVARSDLI